MDETTTGKDDAPSAIARWIATNPILTAFILGVIFANLLHVLFVLMTEREH